MTWHIILDLGSKKQPKVNIADSAVDDKGYLVKKKQGYLEGNEGIL